jgi:hypothetical protein
LWHYPLLYSFDIGNDPWNLRKLSGYVLFLCILSGITYRFVEFRNVGDWRSLFLIRESRGLGRRVALPWAHCDVNTSRR